MKKFKVISLSVAGTANRVLRSGEIIEESYFGKKRSEELVKAGFLEEIKTEKKAAAKKPAAKTEASK
jgi:hypothetical protein